MLEQAAIKIRRAIMLSDIIEDLLGKPMPDGPVANPWGVRVEVRNGKLWLNGRAASHTRVAAEMLEAALASVEALR